MLSVLTASLSLPQNLVDYQSDSEATGWLGGHLVGLFSGLYDRQPSEDEMEQIRESVFSFMPELRATLLETIQMIRKSILKNTDKQIIQ